MYIYIYTYTHTYLLIIVIFLHIADAAKEDVPQTAPAGQLLPDAINGLPGGWSISTEHPHETVPRCGKLSKG